MFQRIHDLREARGITQEEVAQYLNVHQTTYSNYELGKTSIPVLLIGKLADFYKTSVDYLMGRTNEIKPYPKK